MTDKVLVPVEVVDFLCGAGELNGLSFGDVHPITGAKYWWREHLHNCPPVTPTDLAALEKQMALKWCRRAFMRITEPAFDDWRIEQDARIYWYPDEIRYLEANGMLERHSDVVEGGNPEWIRIKEGK